MFGKRKEKGDGCHHLGFSLVELLVSMVVLVTGVLAVALMIVYAFVSNRFPATRASPIL